MTLDSQWKYKRFISNTITSDQKKKKKDLHAAFVYHFCSEICSRRQLVQSAGFWKSKHQERNRRNSKVCNRHISVCGSKFPTGKTQNLSLADRVTYINSRSECFEFHSHSLMKINEENWRVSSISHCFPEVIQNPSAPSETLSWYKEVGVPFPEICF